MIHNINLDIKMGKGILGKGTMVMRSLLHLLHLTKHPFAPTNNTFVSARHTLNQMKDCSIPILHPFFYLINPTPVKINHLYRNNYSAFLMANYHFPTIDSRARKADSYFPKADYLEYSIGKAGYFIGER